MPLEDEPVIRQLAGDLLEIEWDDGFFYVVVLTKIVQFGGNIVFAHHTGGQQLAAEEIVDSRKGFNVCTDLLLPKKEGVVRRLHRHEDVSTFWLTQYAKYCHEHRPGRKAEEWFIYDIKDLRTEIARVREMPQAYREAMDSGTYSFDLVAEKILAGYTPDQNQFLERRRGWLGQLLGRGPG